MDAFYFAASAAAVWGAAAFIEKLGVSGGNPLGGVLARSLGVLGGAVLFALARPSVLKSAASLPGRSFALFALGGALASVAGQIFFYQALQKGHIGRVAAVGGSWPALAFVLSVLFLGEPLTGRNVAGIVLVLAGVMMLR